MAEQRLIDLDKAIEATRKEIYWTESRAADVRAFLFKQPKVDAVPVVHGRWIDRPSMKGQVYCSECATIEKSTDSNYKSQRCPNCGAKMDGDANG